MPRAALVSICHGAGPLPALEDSDHASMIRHMREDVPKILKLNTAQSPQAILVLTAHWQTSVPKISNGQTHRLMYDYSGFPEAGYSITYDAPGAPGVAQRAVELLGLEAMEARLDPTRGWDHGVFIPMKLINPSGSVPIVQMSILASQKAPELLRMGRALAPLRDENVAILGSGSPGYHNIGTWFSAHDVGFSGRQAAWLRALEKNLQIHDEAEQRTALERWRDLPHSYEMHPRGAAEHFSTLLVCAGAANGAAAHFESFPLAGAEQTTCWWD